MITTLEQLPDEILLLICQHLPQKRIALAFFGLNERLDGTVSQYLTSLTVTGGYYNDRRDGCELLALIGSRLHSLTIQDTRLSSTQLALAPNIEELNLVKAPRANIPVGVP